MRNLPSTDSYLFSDGDIILQLRSTAGVTKVKILDSSTVEVASIDSDGNASFTGLAATSDFAVTGALTARSVSSSSALSGVHLSASSGAAITGALTARSVSSSSALSGVHLSATSDAAITGALTARSVSSSSALSGVHLSASSGAAITGALTARSVSSSSALAGVHITASSNFIGTGYVQAGGFIDSYLPKTTATVLVAIPNKGFTSLAQTGTTQVTWTLEDPMTAGMLKTIFVLSQIGTTARTFVVPASSNTVFSSTQGSTGRKITFNAVGEACSMVSASTTVWLVYNSQSAVIGSS